MSLPGHSNTNGKCLSHGPKLVNDRGYSFFFLCLGRVRQSRAHCATPLSQFPGLLFVYDADMGVAGLALRLRWQKLGRFMMVLPLYLPNCQSRVRMSNIPLPGLMVCAFT